MAKTHITPKEISEALAMREAGYTVLAISQRLGVGVRTLQRHFASAGTRKGAVKSDLLDRAKAELLARITSDEAIKSEAARLVADDLAHSMHLREVILAASEKMTATNLEEAALVMRAAAAYSTVMKNTSDIIRHSLRVEQRDNELDELPELVVSELTSMEIENLRGTQDGEVSSPEITDADEVVELA